ncbi:MAG: RidA family protein [Acidobacteriia bacterium]|nr:RidA family protein [Terriglobia bacterium]
MSTTKRRLFLKGAALTGIAASPAVAAATSGKQKVDGGVKLGNTFYSSGLTGKGSTIGEQTDDIMKKHKANLQALGSSLDNVVKVTAFLADVRKEKPEFNKAYAPYFPKDAPSRTALGAIFPDDQTRVEIELVAWVP